MQKHFNLFEKWIYKFSREVIMLSSKYPLISGFYKLIALCMRIANKTKYFHVINTDTATNEIENNEQSFDEAIQFDDTLKFERFNCFYLCKKYVKEIHVRMKQFKDELLASCLEFILSLPKELISHNLDEAFQALEVSKQNKANMLKKNKLILSSKVSLELGLNYLPVADNALNSLEYWLESISLNKLKPFYTIVLRKFDDYLQMNKSIDEAGLIQDKVLVLKLKHSGRGRKKIPVKLFQKNTTVDNIDLYEQIQFRILRILGQFSGEMSHCLYDTDFNSQITSWDTIKYLKFYVPFIDIKPVIYFDRFLPRIVYLALSSTNRQTKVNACELLHAIVVYMIGKSVSDPHASISVYYQMNKIYHHIYPTLFRLACDVDNFARNLFQPLVMQMIHWFTGNRKYESIETVELLNCIMNSLVNEKDAALRDFSATALKEFLKWSIKHTPLAKQDSNTMITPINVKSILKRIFNLLTHPNSYKRLGATLAWNSIYVIFREEESLVNKHIFELLYYLIESLSLAEKDDKMHGTQELAKLGLDHVERIIRTKSEILNQRNNERVKPPGWSESLLEVAVRWLMRQCGRTETECRHKSMDLVFKLAPFIEGIKETKKYFQVKYELEKETYFLARFEGSTEKREILKDCLCNFPTLKDLGTTRFQISSIQTWLTMLVAPLDCYCWVFGERLLTPLNLFSSGKSVIWSSLSYFIENMINLDLNDLIKNIYITNIDQQELNVHTPNELEDYRRSKCTAIIRFIDFLCTMIGSYPNDSLKVIPQNIWSHSLFTCLVNMCLEPEVIGFNLNDLEVFTQLPMKMQSFLKLFTKHVHLDVQLSFKATCKSLIQKNELIEKTFNQLKDKTNMMTSISIDWLKLAQLMSGYELLCQFNLCEIASDYTKILFDFLAISHNFDPNEQESLTCIEAKRKLFNICLTINYLSFQTNENNLNQTDYLVEIVDKYLFELDKSISAYFNYYKTEICTWICRRYEFIFKYIISKIDTKFFKCISLFESVLDYLLSEKQNRKLYGQKVVHYLYENWPLFKKFWQSDANLLDEKTILVNLLTKSISIESVIAVSNKDFMRNTSEMYMNLLIDNKTKCNFKCKLLDLLHFFCDSPAPFLMKTYMSQFVTQLPLKSSELVRGEDSYNDYVSVIRKMLVSLELTGSFDLLSIIVNIFCREAEHVCDEEISLCLNRLIKRLESSKQATIIDFYWENSFKHNSVNEDLRKFIVFRKVIMNFLKNCEKPVFIEFISSNIIFMMNILDSDLKVFFLFFLCLLVKQKHYLFSLNFTKDSSLYEWFCMTKKSVFEVIEIAYKRLHKDEIFFSNAKICSTYETAKFGQIKDGKELTKEVLRKCRKFLNEKIQISTSILLDQPGINRLENVQRQLHCSAYNCLIALFVCTQTEPKLYLAFLFKEDVGKVTYVFAISNAFLYICETNKVEFKRVSSSLSH
jgi:DNA-dependent protein kinase catalytic subunit